MAVHLTEVRESATQAKTITEARTVVEATPIGTDGRFLLRLIDAGKGSSGIYPATTLEAAAKDKVFPAGTHCFMDHPGYAESYDRPERSVKDLAAVLSEDARWDAGSRSLVAEARVFGAYRELLTDMADSIGVSIRATAEFEQGRAEGYEGTVITKLVEGISTDFVTRAGRGGKIMSVLESARIAEATTSDREDQIQRALPPRSYLRDFDADLSVAYFVSYDPTSDRGATWQQSYEVASDDQSVTLTGQPAEVRPVMTYVLVASQAATESDPNSSPRSAVEESTTTPNGGTPMAEIADAELTKLRESAGQAETLLARAEKAEKALAESRLRDAATARAREAVKDLHPAMADRIVESSTRSLPTAQDGTLDTAAYDAKVAEAIKAEQDYAAQFASAGGKVTGFGASTAVAAESTTPGNTYVNAWGRTVTKES